VIHQIGLNAVKAALVLGLTAGAGVVLNQGAAFADPVTVAPVTLPTFADLAEKVSPAVVSVRVRLGATTAAAQTGNGNGAAPIPPQGQRGGTALGSGFFISGDGYVVTNNHVVDNASTYTVITSDGTEYTAKLIGKDDKTDLALLKVDASDAFAYVKWADAEPRIGDWVVAVGNPFGLGGTVTMGIVSARGRQLSSGPYDDYIQIDAPINRGNSGGPTFNTKGEVIGINTAIYSTSGGSVGIAFDIPASTAAGIVGALKDHGAIVRGWLGVQTQSVTPTIAESVKLTTPKGAMVSEPQAGSPADVAGIKAGDIIVSLDGKAVNDPRDLALQIAQIAPNTTVRVSVWRNGTIQDISVKLGMLPTDPVVPVPAAAPTPPRGGGGGGNGTAPRSQTDAAPRDGTAIPELGLSAASAHDRPSGVDIFNVAPNGPADEAGLSDGDVILSIGTIVVSSAADVQGAISAARQAGDKALLLRVQSGPNVAFLAIPLG
jgi:serine protease Do